MSEEAQSQTDSKTEVTLKAAGAQSHSMAADDSSKQAVSLEELGDKSQAVVSQTETVEVVGEKAALTPLPGRNRTIVILLYGLLLLSASIALLSSTSGAVPAPLSVISPIAFAVFFVIFAIYRCVQVYRRRFPMPKAIFQIGFGALFGILLVSAQSKLSTDEIDQRPLKPLREMLQHADPSVRALACDAFATLSDAEKKEARGALEALKNDRNAAVRQRAERALSVSEQSP